MFPSTHVSEPADASGASFMLKDPDGRPLNLRLQHRF